MSKIKFIICLVQLCVVFCDREPAVRTPLGELRGYNMTTRGGRRISAFTSIPFVEPPIGPLRFKAPVPISPWERPVDATRETPLCVQRNPYTRQVEIVGQEDCLYLNIYTPYSSNDILDGKRLLPVMFFIHGGGWMCLGSDTDHFGPEYLLDRDIVLVTTNYRLGPLGFLSTQDEHCPGNNGLKDQQEALRFVQKVIDKFGGDRNSVTIFGESAGGASVHLHMLSETSSGLFHKAIAQSGTAMVPWAEAPPGEALRNAFRLAKLLDCPQAPSDVMLACLRQKDSYDIINTEFRFYSWDYEPMTPFKAVVEPNLPGAFLTRSVRKKPNVPAVPFMTGLTRDEGCLKSGWITSNRTRFLEFTSGFDTIAPVSFYYENSPYIEEITRKIKHTYLKRCDGDTIESGVLQLYSDSYFAYPLVEAVELTLSYTTHPVYLYELAYEGVNSLSQVFGFDENDPNKYVCHADDLIYLFPIHFLKYNLSDEDVRMSQLIVTLFTNFATSGNPNKPITIPFVWRPATSGKKMEYAELGNNVMKEGLAARARFWSALPLWHNFRTRFIDEL